MLGEDFILSQDRASVNTDNCPFFSWHLKWHLDVPSIRILQLLVQATERQFDNSLSNKIIKVHDEVFSLLSLHHNINLYLS